MAEHETETVIIGAGVIGMTTALALQRMGRRVRVLDRGGIAAEASAGNAGAFAFSDIEPLATPGILRKAPRWLLDPLGPLSVPPAYALRIAPWMVRFWRASWRDRYTAAVAAQAALMALSRDALERLITEVDGEPLMQRDGQMQLYEGEAAYRAALPGWDLRRRHGVAFEVLDTPAAIAAIQPGLDARFTHAVFTPDWLNTINPLSWVQHLAERFRAAGGQIDTRSVRAIIPGETGVILETDAGPLPAAQVVVAAGAWSHRLARGIGDRFPLETERGYNTTLPAGALDLRTHLTFPAHGFVLSRISGGVRVGGAVELGGLTRAPDYRRADILLRKAARFLPALDTRGGTQWMGFRPSLPDSLPVIDRSPRVPQVFYAFGHGHLGLTQSAGTAELVAALMQGDPVSMPMSPYRATRF